MSLYAIKLRSRLTCRKNAKERNWKVQMICTSFLLLRQILLFSCSANQQHHDSLKTFWLSLFLSLSSHHRVILLLLRIPFLFFSCISKKKSPYLSSRYTPFSPSHLRNFRIRLTYAYTIQHNTIVHIPVPSLPIAQIKSYPTETESRSPKAYTFFSTVRGVHYQIKRAIGTYMLRYVLNAILLYEWLNMYI